MLEQMPHNFQPHKPDATSTDARWARRAIALVALLSLFRLYYAGTLELAGDEAYYWLWSRHLDYGYYSKGPGVAWAIALTTRLLGDTERTVRLPAIMFSIVSSWALFRLAKRLFDAETAFWTLAVAATLPPFLVGSWLMTIDPLSVAFWLLGAMALRDALDHDRLWAWAAAGGAVALGILSKFTNLVELVCFAIVLGRERGRAAWRRPGPWLMVGLALAGLVPPLVWNARHGWVTVQHLWSRGGLAEPFRPHLLSFLGFLATQAAILSPLYTWALVALVRRRELWTARTHAYEFLGAVSLPLMIGYALLSFTGEWEANWTAPALAVAPVALAGLAVEYIRRQPERRPRALTILLVHALLGAVAYAAAAGPWLFGNERFRRIGGAADLAQRVEALRQRHDASFVIAGGYQLASLLTFYTPDHPTVYVPDRGRVENQFAFWPGYRSQRSAGENALWVGRSPAPPELSKQFAKVESLGTVEPCYRGRRMRPHHVALLKGLRPDRGWQDRTTPR